MKIIRVANYKEMSLVAFSILKERIKLNSNLNLGLATGSTPEGVYKLLIQAYENSEVTFKNIKTFNLDEYVNISGDDINSYRYFMFNKLFNHVDMEEHNVNIPNGMASDLEKECKRHEQKIEKSGGIDVQILGIGENGHIAFNEPGTSFYSKTHIVELEESTREANARFFNDINQVPTHAITMGLSTIMKSKEILLLVSGKSKSDAINKLFKGEISEQFPASILHKHANVTIIVDDEAYLPAN